MSGISSDSSILIATTNPAKRAMLAWLLEGLAMRLQFPEEVQQPIVVEETEPTHRGNAVLKAVAWSRACGGMAIASDGGLRIESLGAAWDSVRTARFAGPGADDRARLERLLELMAPYSGEERRARWVEAVAVCARRRAVGDVGIRGWRRSCGGLLRRRGADARVLGGKRVVLSQPGQAVQPAHRGGAPRGWRAVERPETAGAVVLPAVARLGPSARRRVSPPAGRLGGGRRRSFGGSAGSRDHRAGGLPPIAGATGGHRRRRTA